MMSFATCQTIRQVEEGTELAPKFAADGLLPCVTTDHATGEVLMLGWMDAAALGQTILTGEVHYFSRSRQAVWHTGATSRLIQTVVEMRIDHCLDVVWLRVRVAGSGASCHVGYRSCFYRAVPTGGAAGRQLCFTEDFKVFDPATVYGDTPNPTQL